MSDLPASSLEALPDDLPIPVDDGACEHLQGSSLPSIELPSTDDQAVDLAMLPGRSVVFAYPMTGQPGRALPVGWNDIPGARGCTPQSCSFRDLHGEFTALGAKVFGLSTQQSDYQHEVVERLHLPFAMLSDADLVLSNALSLPTFDIDGMTLIRRLTLIIDNGRIERVFYPVFPPRCCDCRRSRCAAAGRPLIRRRHCASNAPTSGAFPNTGRGTSPHGAVG